MSKCGVLLYCNNYRPILIKIQPYWINNLTFQQSSSAAVSKLNYSLLDKADIKNNMSRSIENSFPIVSLLPKSETGVINFLQKYPDFNGRDVTIAILDSGVDPRATGLQKLPDGSIKVIERFDCSGCGDTDVSKKVTATDGTVTGLSGRILKLTPYMISSNKDGKEYHIGLKSLHDLYPSKIREKVAGDIKLKKWDEPQKTAMADISRKLIKFESQNSDPQNLSLKDKLKKEDLDNSLEFLNCYEKRFLDIRTTYDCIVFPTEKGWNAVIDISEVGDLENGLLIGEYTKTYEIKNIDDYLSVSINVHDEGNTLEIVGMCSSHGTHVASIASGNNSNKDVDGIAPSAKIVSLTIGDGRLGSMETGTALVRAMVKIMEFCKNGKKIDIINMSYGEHAHWSNSGRLGELMSEVVNNYGVVWVASAGNHGPALGTIGTPPDLSQPNCIGVGAYVSPQMMEAEYSLREKLPHNVYTWTSRDPCIDGGQGVTLCAPGAAIASVPEFTMSRAQLMNGTSMAAPHVAGAIALLISGLKQKGIQYSPFSIKRALTATATKLGHVDKFAQGSGLLNVEKAFEHLVQYANEQENMIRFSVKVGAHSKGIHIRQNYLKKPSEHNVTIEPFFFNEKEAAPSDKINFNVRLNLICTEPWIKCGEYLDLCYTARTICLTIDPVGLSPGVHTGCVKAYDTSNIEKGSLFDIPITLVQPFVTDSDKSRTFYSNGAVEFKPNTIQRDFILVPNKATWAVLRMVSVDKNENHIGKFYIHTMQILPMTYCKALETMKMIAVNSDSDSIHAFKVEQNNILELCIAKYWSNFGDTHLKYSLEFHGVSSISPNATTMLAAHGVHRIDIQSYNIEDISPNIQLKTGTIILKPTETKITPLSAERDVIPDGRQIYQNVLTYNLHLQKAQEISLYVPLLYTTLYESEYESQLWMIFDTNKMLIKCGDAYSDATYMKLDKGDYTVRLQVRHEKKDLLEKLQDMNMLATFKLQTITLDIYDHYSQAIIGGRKYTNGQINSNMKKSLYLLPITNERLTKANLPTQCTWLNGTLTYAKDEYGRKVDISLFQYILPDGPPQNKKSNGNSGTGNATSTATNTSSTASTVSTISTVSTASTTSGTSAGSTTVSSGGGDNSSPKKANKKKSDEYKESLRDFQCGQIPKLDFELAEEVYLEIIKNHPKYLPVHMMFVQQLENVENKIQFPFTFSKLLKTESDDQKQDMEKLTVNLKRIIQLCDIVILQTATDSLLMYYGIKNDTRPDASKIKINMDKQKASLLEAWVKKGIAIAKLITVENHKINEQSVPSATSNLEEIERIYIEIGKFIDTNDSKVVNFSIWHAYVNRHFGRMAKYLQKMYEDKNNRDILEELLCVAEAKKWQHIMNAINKITISANPITYRPF